MKKNFKYYLGVVTATVVLNGSASAGDADPFAEFELLTGARKTIGRTVAPTSSPFASGRFDAPASPGRDFGIFQEDSIERGGLHVDLRSGCDPYAVAKRFIKEWDAIKTAGYTSAVKGALRDLYTSAITDIESGLRTRYSAHMKLEQTIAASSGRLDMRSSAEAGATLVAAIARAKKANAESGKSEELKTAAAMTFRELVGLVTEHHSLLTPILELPAEGVREKSIGVIIGEAIGVRKEIIDSKEALLDRVAGLTSSNIEYLIAESILKDDETICAIGSTWKNLTRLIEELKESDRADVSAVRIRLLAAATELRAIVAPHDLETSRKALQNLVENCCKNCESAGLEAPHLLARILLNDKTSIRVK